MSTELAQWRKKRVASVPHAKLPRTVAERGVARDKREMLQILGRSHLNRVEGDADGTCFEV